MFDSWTVQTMKPFVCKFLMVFCQGKYMSLNTQVSKESLIYLELGSFVVQLGEQIGYLKKDYSVLFNASSIHIRYVKFYLKKFSFSVYLFMIFIKKDIVFFIFSFFLV